jgi:hypothetical protein
MVRRSKSPVRTHTDGRVAFGRHGLTVSIDLEFGRDRGDRIAQKSGAAIMHRSGFFVFLFSLSFIKKSAMKKNFFFVIFCIKNEEKKFFIFTVLLAFGHILDFFRLHPDDTAS